MRRDVHTLAQQLLHKSYDALTRREQEVIQRIAQRIHISRNVRAEHDEQLTFGQRLADRVAAFGGSWPFILIFLAVLVAMQQEQIRLLTQIIENERGPDR